MTAPEPLDLDHLEALGAEQRATLLRVLDWGVESRNMTHSTALQILGLADALPALIAAARAREAEVAKAKAEGRDEAFAAVEQALSKYGTRGGNSPQWAYAALDDAHDLLRGRADLTGGTR